MKKIIILTVTITTILIAYLVNLNSNKDIKAKQKTNNELIDQQVSLESSDNEQLNNEIIGTLEIKKIGLKGEIKEGSTKEILKDYIGHIENTPVYDGNVCLAAHNRGNLYSYFSRLNELKYGDEIIYKTKFFENHYQVDKIKEIDEQDWNLLEDTTTNKLTLITCIKNQRNKRLCVQATIDNK